MFVEAKNTCFDSPERSTFLQIENKSHRINRDPIITQMLESFPDLVLILDSNRQIVAYNKKADSFFMNKMRLKFLATGSVRLLDVYTLLKIPPVVVPLHIVLHAEQAE